MGTWSPNIEDKVFIVTGGSVGVGAAIVKTLLAENARYVAYLDIKDREGSALESDLLYKFGALRAKYIKCDIGDEEELDEAIQQVFEKYRRLDVIINNAAVLADEKEYKRMVNINFLATVSSSLKAMSIMTAENEGAGGTILNVSSLLALTHHSELPVYSATKTAVLHFSNSIGAEDTYSRTKVRVLTVCLGPTDTAIYQRQNFDKNCATNLTSRVSVRQRVDSAATGIVEVIKRGQTGSTWVVANDNAATDISDTVKEGFGVLSSVVN